MNKYSDLKDTDFSPKTVISYGGKTLDLSEPKVMGILNVTPDSFYDGGKYENEESLYAQVDSMLTDGVDLIDIGAQSTRPGAEEVPLKQELLRVKSALKVITEVSDKVLVSIDTYKSEVAKMALDDGAFMINDVSGGTLDEKMFPLIGKNNVPYIMMHMKGNPQNMQTLANYHDLTDEVLCFFKERIEMLDKLGGNQTIIDPGFGFAKTLDQNYELLSDINSLQKLAKPLLVGVSRKSMIYKLLNITPVEALNGTTVLNTVALLNGASILRVHDVKEAREAVTLVSKL